MQTTNYSILPDVIDAWCQGKKRQAFLPFLAARSCVRSDMFEYCKNVSDVFAATPNTPDVFTASERREGSRVCFASGSPRLRFAEACHVEHLTAMLDVYICFSGPCTRSNN